MKRTYAIGDIIIFKAPNKQFLSQCIALLTDSDVSHAAMICGEDMIIESGRDHVAVSPITEETGHNAYILRLAAHPDTTSLIATAAAYRDGNIGYDFPALVIVGGLLVFRRIPASPEVIALAGRLLLPASLALDKFIQHYLLHNPERAMLCSQLIYQIFYDAGPEYRIQFENTTLETNDGTAGNTVCLADLLAESGGIPSDCLPPDGESSDSALSKALPNPAAQPMDIEYLAKEFLGALLETKDLALKNTRCGEAIDYDAVLPAVREFVSKLEAVKEKLKADIPIDGLFITPADILYHTKNLERIGTTQIIHINAHVE